MKLIIFDIDGTLSNTNEIDNSGFSKAFSDVMQHHFDDSVWEGCQHITDLGLIRHVFKKKYARLPRIFEVNRIKNALIEHFEFNFRSDPSLFREVQGAVNFFHYLKDTPGVAVAIATGCWKASATFKLDAIKLNYLKVPFAHSDQLSSRAEITLDAIEQAKIKYRCMAFDRITYIGDGLWDLETSKALKLNFIGIDCNGSGMLKDHGAEVVFNHFDEPNLLSAILD